MPIDEVATLIKEKCRLCPGTHVATSESTLLATAATVLSTFNLYKSVDIKDGRVIEPSREYHVGLIR